MSSRNLPVIKSENIFQILVSEWTTLTEIVDILEIVNDATIIIQTPDFNLADFFCCWIRINGRLNRRKETANIRTDLADSLIQNLGIRKSALLKHPAMLCAVYLDHRVYKKLLETEILIAKIALANLHVRICNLKSQHKENNLDDRAKFMELLDTFRATLQCEKRKTSSTFWESKKLLCLNLSLSCQNRIYFLCIYYKENQ